MRHRQQIEAHWKLLTEVMPFDFDVRAPSRQMYGSYQVLGAQRMHDCDLSSHVSLCLPTVQWRVAPTFAKGCLDSPVASIPGNVGVLDHGSVTRLLRQLAAGTCVWSPARVASH